MFDRSASHDVLVPRTFSSTGRIGSTNSALRTSSSVTTLTLNLAKLDEETNLKIHVWKKKFWWFAMIASLNHALNYVVTSFATSLLDDNLGGIILGLSWCLNAVSGMTVATPIVRGMGFKYSMVLSLWGYAVQIASLYWAVVSNDVNTRWTVAIAGAVISGFTSAVWWTSQGVYFEEVCQAIDRVYVTAHPGKESIINSARADLSAHWTIIYQSADIAVFLCLSIFPLIFGCGVHPVILGLTFMGAGTAVLGMTFDALPTDKSISVAELVEAAVAVPKQVAGDARVSLLAPFVFGFGISTAMFAYYVNSAIVSDSSGLGQVSLGFLEAFSYFIAVLAAYPYAYIANNYVQGQDWVIQFGSLAFMLSGFFVLVLKEDQLGTWGAILFIKGLYGLGRGVFEGSCRAVYASMFKGKDLSTAFSCQTLSVGFSGGICFFLFSVMKRQDIAGITVANGLLAIGAYFIIMFMVDPNEVLPWRTLYTCKCSGRPKRNVVHDDIKPDQRDMHFASVDHTLKTSLLSDPERDYSRA